MYTYSIQGIQEGVEQVGCSDFDRLIQLIVNLVKNNLLRIDQGKSSNL
jgi:hypothetical protein